MVRNLGPTRLAVMGGVVLGLIGFFIFLTTRLTTPQMSLLYGDLQQDDSARIVNQLEGMAVPFELKRGGAERSSDSVLDGGSRGGKQQYCKNHDHGLAGNKESAVF